MNKSVPGELIGSCEAFSAAWLGTGVRLRSGVSPELYVQKGGFSISRQPC